MSQQWRNCRAVVKQIKNGEWEPVYNPLANSCLTAKRRGKEMWISEGPWFVDSYPHTNAFGLLGRHYVYWAAVRKFKKSADKEARKARVEDFTQ